jgi:hypothetical protein
MGKIKTGLVVLGVSVGGFLLMGSSCDTHGSSDYGTVSHGPADVIEFPDGYRNVASKCDGPNRVYSGSSASSDSLPAAVAVVPNDPRCTGVK